MLPLRLIVSKRHANTGYDHMWAVLPDGTIKVKPKLFDYEDYAKINMARLQTVLPWCVFVNILVKLVDSYLAVYDFDSLAEICNINKEVTDMMYGSMYGWGEEVKPARKVFRMRKTFDILYTIHTHRIISPQVGRDIYYLRLGRGFVRSLFGDIQPWDFHGNFELSGILANTDLDGFTLKKYFIGPLSGQMCYIDGNFDDEGVLEARQIFTPVISLCLAKSNRTIMPTRAMIEDNEHFQKFADLLIKIYGERTMVNFMVKPDNSDEEDEHHFSDIQVVYSLQ
jgi:hypothetical protein